MSEDRRFYGLSGALFGVCSAFAISYQSWGIATFLVMGWIDCMVHCWIIAAAAARAK